MTSAQGKSVEIKINKLTSVEQDKSVVKRERGREAAPANADRALG